MLGAVEGGIGAVEHVDFRYQRAPMIVYWELTTACGLACRHCRAEAEDRRHPEELTTAEGKALVAGVAEMGTPLIVFTGGDPLQREDLEELVGHGKEVGLRVGVIPAATSRLTHQRVRSRR